LTQKEAVEVYTPPVLEVVGSLTSDTLIVDYVIGRGKT
jgi:hypothetical protein